MHAFSIGYVDGNIEFFLSKFPLERPIVDSQWFHPVLSIEYSRANSDFADFVDGQRGKTCIRHDSHLHPVGQFQSGRLSSFYC